MKKQQILAGMCTLLALGFSSCGNDKAFEQTETGLKYKFYQHDEKGTKPKVGDFIIVHMVGKTSKDSVIFNTYKEGEPFTIGIMAPSFKGSMEEAFMMMSKGDSASFSVNADSMYAKTFMQPLPPFIEKGSDITFTLKVVDIMTSQQRMEKEGKAAMEQKGIEDAKMKAYIEANKDKFKTTASGLMYEVITANPKGRQVKTGDSVQVHYTGMLLDGTKFDSSVERGEPIALNVGAGMVIQGWDEGLLLMREGEKMKLVIPYTLGYGERGAGGSIPPYANLVFEMELVKIH